MYVATVGLVVNEQINIKMQKSTVSTMDNI